MAEMESGQPANGGITRRTVAKGMAWAVPAMAVAATVPFAAASPPPEPPPPTFDFANGWKNPGNSCTSACIPKQSYGVKVIVSNPSETDFILEFSSYAVGTQTPGVFGITGSVQCGALPITQCSIPANCPQDLPATTKRICVPAGTTEFAIYVTSNEMGSSPQGAQKVGWAWRNASTCLVTASDTATSSTSPPNDAC